MPDPSTYRPAPGTVPDSPGVYRFRAADGRVLYVGKAKNLRQRLASYFADLTGLHPRTQQLVTTAASVDWVIVATEVEALQLEYSWIKEYDPRFNVRYRDDKSYPSLAVTLNEEYPRLMIMRGPRKKGVRYFGPFPHAWAIRETLDLLLRVFPARTCTAGVFARAHRIGRPCLLGDIGKCSAPCVGRVDAATHRRIVEDFCDFMAGRTDQLTRRLERQMREAADELEFERAARLRDDLEAVRRVLEKQAVVFGDGTDADVMAFAEDALEAAVQVFHVRGGRIRGQRGWVVEKNDEVSAGDLVKQFCLQVYGDLTKNGEAGQAYGAAGDPIPREVLVPVLPADVEALTALLSAERGSQVSVRVPQRGDKRALLETVRRNAEQALVQHKLRRVSNLSTRSAALTEIAEALDLPEAPLRIECYDISQMAGTDVVGSMIVFEDGLARKSEYRRFAVRGQRTEPGGPVEGLDDTAALAEVLRRRFARASDARPDDARPDEVRPDEVTTGRGKRFAYSPNLVLVDGGAPQVAAATSALADLGVTGVAVAGLAKRLEEVWLPAEAFPVILPRTSEGLYLLQRVRDEAHRFAIAYHRQKRSRRMTVSALDDIPGLGEFRRKALLRHFGSLKRLRAASVEEVASVPGIGRRTAEALVAALRSPDELTKATTAEVGPRPPRGEE